METVFVFYILCLGLSLATPTFWREFQEYKAIYGKSYLNKEEENNRLSTFSQNLRRIMRHNDEYNKGKHSYTIGINKYSDLTHQRYRPARNVYQRHSIPKVDHIFQQTHNDDFPVSFDWRDKGAVTEVKDQGECRSSWTFSATGALEAQHFLKTGELISLSEQNLIDCTYENIFDDPEPCVWGSMGYANFYIEENGGVDTEESYPYVGELQNCRFNRSDIGATNIGFTYVPGTVEALKGSVANIGPISAWIFDTYGDFDFYESGIYCCAHCSGLINNAVLIVGYGTSDNGTDYWLVKNSMGTTWGEDGYMKVCQEGITLDIFSYPLV